MKFGGKGIMKLTDGGARVKVYDCFTFFNELELLELRLKLLDNVVDYFVLVEANKTYKGEIKPFNFEKNKKQFAGYLHKIIYIKIDDMPDYSPKNIWELEYYQRNCISRGLQDLQPEDIIFISDVDEIPNPNIIEWLNNNQCRVLFKTRNKIQLDLIQMLKFPECVFQRHGMKLLDRTPLALEQTLFYYFVNCRSKGSWNGTVVTKAENFSTPQKLRDRREKFPRIRNSGWHFSYLGGIDKILLKLNSIVNINEAAEAKADIYSTSHIKKCLISGSDIYGRKGQEYEYEFIDLANISPEPMKDLVQKYPYLYFTEQDNKYN